MTPGDPVYRVLLVCTGNTCRSPMAAGALLVALGGDAEQVRVESAGTAAWEGQPATEPARRVAAAGGVDLGGHRSRRVTPAMVRSADIVLVMERGHLAAVRALGADPERSHLLSEWPAPGEPGLEISDPFGASSEAYEECWRRIRHHVDRVLPAIREASRARSA
ncbi:MAG: low molecular weight protein arginine phosphatase [Candidatus Eisenbacteria bacterium]|uniref:Low molecular weight protein arginine phosphatase n=1 Tax=Eiseniibacteriota bacterium TaxID=2212470 RepID=A0A538U8N9_UNCEI|nr:MAG: low molecular weight protein arginine phosphatase [Candidatus Eisenbacteria bacterium]